VRDAVLHQDEISFSKEEDAEKWCSGCTVYLAVYGYTEGEFTLTVNAGMITLQSAIPMTGHVSSGSMAYFRIYNADPTAHVLVTVTTLVGDPDMWVRRRRRGAHG
jgi:hypothetical protein